MSAIFVLISKGYEIFLAFGLYILILIGFFFLIKRPVYAYYLTVFTIPFKSLYIWVGTNIEVWKLMSAMSLILYVQRVLMNTSHKISKNHKFAWLIFFVTYSLFITLFFSLIIPEADKHTMVGGFFKNEGRIFFQIIFFLITINLILWPSYIFKNTNQVFYTFRIIILSVLTLSVFGLIQLVSLYTTGYDPFPIHRVHGLDYTGGMIFAHGFDSIQRLNSLAGEPKHFAIALIIGFLILMLHRLNNIQIVRHELSVMGIFFVCLTATYSTTGYIWFGVTIVSIIAFYRQKFTGASLFLILLAALSLYIINSGTSGGNYSYIEKTINKTGLETQDEAVLGYFKDNSMGAITGLGLGNIHHYAVRYLPPAFPIFRDTPFKGNSGFFLLLGDVGLIGIFLLTGFIYKLVIGKNNYIVTGDSDNLKQFNILAHIIIISSLLFLMRYFELFYVSLGLIMFFRSNPNIKHSSINIKN